MPETTEPANNGGVRPPPLTSTAVPLANMLPEVAFIKLGWALGVHSEVQAFLEKVWR